MNSIQLKEFHIKSISTCPKEKSLDNEKKKFIFAGKRTKPKEKARKRILPQTDPIKVTQELRLSPPRPPYTITVFDLQVQPPEKVRPMP